MRTSTYQGSSQPAHDFFYRSQCHPRKHSMKPHVWFCSLTLFFVITNNKGQKTDLWRNLSFTLNSPITLLLNRPRIYILTHFSAFSTIFLCALAYLSTLGHILYFLKPKTHAGCTGLLNTSPTESSLIYRVSNILSQYDNIVLFSYVHYYFLQVCTVIAHFYAYIIIIAMHISHVPQNQYLYIF